MSDLPRIQRPMAMGLTGSGTSRQLHAMPAWSVQSPEMSPLKTMKRETQPDGTNTCDVDGEESPSVAPREH
jgi:hypothetical protein